MSMFRHDYSIRSSSVRPPLSISIWKTVHIFVCLIFHLRVCIYVFWGPSVPVPAWYNEYMNLISNRRNMYTLATQMPNIYLKNISV